MKVNYFKRTINKLAKQKIKVYLSKDIDEQTRQKRLSEIDKEINKWIESEVDSKLKQ